MSFRMLSKTMRPYANYSTWKMSIFKRFKSRAECAVHKDPICSKETLRNQKECASKIRRLEAKEEIPKIDSIWENPECCKDPCPEFQHRFDELYYQSSDKSKRKYQQTWVSCPEVKFEPKKICSHENLNFQPIERRSNARKPKTACPMGGSRICMDKKGKVCPRVMMPGCRGARQPPKCKRQRSIKDCSKECAPYPSYSECLRKQPSQLHPVECQCLDHPLMCEVWVEMRRRMTYAKNT